MTERPADIILEACIETVEQAVMAQLHGADRIELCSNLDVGGLTPGRPLLEAVLAATNLPVMAMVRPRAGNFIYNPAEIKDMKKTIDWLGEAGVHGVVFGMLRPDREIDPDQTAMLSEFAGALEVTFHKAIDETPDPVASALLLQQIPAITRILTSGGRATALEGQTELRKMVQNAGEQLTILAAGSITTNNLAEVHRAIHTHEYHGRRIVF